MSGKEIDIPSAISDQPLDPWQAADGDLIWLPNLHRYHKNERVQHLRSARTPQPSSLKSIKLIGEVVRLGHTICGAEVN